MPLGDQEGPSSTHGAYVPGWVHDIGTAVWISGPDRLVGFINRRAEQLLGLEPFCGEGHPCYRLIGGRGPSAERFCGPQCPVLALARQGLPIPPYDLTVENPLGDTRRIQVLVIPITDPAARGISLVHCAFDRDRARRIEKYLVSLASHTGSGAGVTPAARMLTVRERDVLTRLSRNDSLRSIADELELSYHTVRNHVQHILEKLGAHSMKEAIALHLLESDRTGYRRPGGGGSRAESGEAGAS